MKSNIGFWIILLCLLFMLGIIHVDRPTQHPSKSSPCYPGRNVGSQG